MRRSVRAAEGAGLENQWAEMSRGFESHGLRHFFQIVKTVNSFQLASIPNCYSNVTAYSFFTVGMLFILGSRLTS